METCCTTAALSVHTPVDLEVSLGTVASAIEQALGNGQALGVQLPQTGSWATWPLEQPDLDALAEGAVRAWIVQRPGCAGVTTRAVLVDGDGEVLAAISAARKPGRPEPTSWRVSLLLGLAAESRAA